MKSEVINIMRPIVFLVAVGSFLQTFGQLVIPDQGGKWVHDDANVLSAETVQQIERFLRYEEDSTSNQIGVYIIKSLNGENIDDLSIRVANAWKIGKANNDNGVLLLIAVEDHLMRIEVGKGLEGVLTDATSGRIRRNEINPHFQQGDYDSGVKAGVVAITRVIHGEYTNDDPPLRTKRKRGSPFITLLIILFFIIISRRRGGGGGGGGYMSRGAWMLPMMLGGMGRSSGGSGGGGGGGSWGGGGSFGGGGSSGSW